MDRDGRTHYIVKYRLNTIIFLKTFCLNKDVMEVIKLLDTNK